MHPEIWGSDMWIVLAKFIVPGVLFEYKIIAPNVINFLTSCEHDLNDLLAWDWCHLERVWEFCHLGRGTSLDNKNNKNLIEQSYLIDWLT